MLWFLWELLKGIALLSITLFLFASSTVPYTRYYWVNTDLLNCTGDYTTAPSITYQRLPLHCTNNPSLSILHPAMGYLQGTNFCCFLDNRYSMTVHRDEVIIEGSLDGKRFRSYE